MKSFQTLFSNLLLGVIPIMISSCGDDNEVTFNDNLSFEFRAIANGADLDFGSTTYTNEAGNEITIDRLKMYVSNVVLINSQSGETLAEEESYHLVSLNAQSQSYSFTIEGLRSDFEFDQIDFAIGVDSERNLSIDNVGDLDPTNDMAWNWNTGYKFFLMEGNFFPPQNEPSRGMIFHIGLDKNYKQFRYEMNGLMDLSSNSRLQFQLDALSPMAGENVIDLNEKSEFMVDEASDKIAENYASGLITLTGIEL